MTSSHARDGRPSSVNDETTNRSSDSKSMGSRGFLSRVGEGVQEAGGVNRDQARFVDKSDREDAVAAEQRLEDYVSAQLQPRAELTESSSPRSRRSP